MAKYVHQTMNQIVFDRVRDLATDMAFLAAYLNQDANSNDEVEQLLRARDIVYEHVYLSLRSRWSSGLDDDGRYLPPDLA